MVIPHFPRRPSLAHVLLRTVQSSAHPQQTDDPLPDFRRLSAVPFHRRLYNLLDAVALYYLPGLGPRRSPQEAHLRIRPGVGAHTPEVSAVLAVLLDPHKGGRPVFKSPGLHDAQRLPDVREGRPEKADSIPPPHIFFHRKGADLLRCHGVVVGRRSAAFPPWPTFLPVTPGRVRVDDVVRFVREVRLVHVTSPPPWPAERPPAAR